MRPNLWSIFFFSNWMDISSFRMKARHSLYIIKSTHKGRRHDGISVACNNPINLYHCTQPASPCWVTSMLCTVSNERKNTFQDAHAVKLLFNSHLAWICRLRGRDFKKNDQVLFSSNLSTIWSNSVQTLLQWLVSWLVFLTWHKWYLFRWHDP